MEISAEVAQALAEGRPVVALESTVIAQGLPRPRNAEVGLLLERTVREGGAVPATIAVLSGVVTIGIGAEGIQRIAGAEDVAKLSTRDLGVATARGSTGGTTVASTARLAELAGISVMATGGIGGVHRGHGRDVSADLQGLHRTPVICVCSGAKAILDLPATREALETLSILVLGWRTDELPAFYSPRSGLDVDARVDTAAEVAAIYRARRELRDSTATLVCAPPPAAAGGSEQIETAIQRALNAATDLGVSGIQVTPYLLAEVGRITDGESLEINIALLENNARVAAEIASALTEIE